MSRNNRLSTTINGEELVLFRNNPSDPIYIGNNHSNHNLFYFYRIRRSDIRDNGSFDPDILINPIEFNDIPEDRKPADYVEDRDITVSKWRILTNYRRELITIVGSDNQNAIMDFTDLVYFTFPREHIGKFREFLFLLRNHPEALRIIYPEGWNWELFSTIMYNLISHEPGSRDGRAIEIINMLADEVWINHQNINTPTLRYLYAEKLLRDNTPGPEPSGPEPSAPPPDPPAPPPGPSAPPSSLRPSTYFGAERQTFFINQWFRINNGHNVMDEISFNELAFDLSGAASNQGIAQAHNSNFFVPFLYQVANLYSPSGPIYDISYWLSGIQAHGRPRPSPALVHEDNQARLNVSAQQFVNWAQVYNPGLLETLIRFLQDVTQNPRQIGGGLRNFIY